MTEPPLVINWEKPLSFASAASTINGIAAGWKRVQKWKEAEGKQLMVTMRTASGEILAVGHLKPEGYSSFSAQGFVGDEPVMIVGHISTLQLTCSLVEKDASGSKTRIGFNPKITQISEVEEK